MKKIVSLLLCLMAIFSLSAVAFADAETVPAGDSVDASVLSSRVAEPKYAIIEDNVHLRAEPSLTGLIRGHVHRGNLLHLVKIPGTGSYYAEADGYKWMCVYMESGQCAGLDGYVNRDSIGLTSDVMPG